MVKSQRLDWEGALPMSKRAQIVASIRQKIADGVEGYTPGSTLPTIANLAVEYGVSTGTVDSAVIELKADGTITGTRGGRLRVPLVGEPNGDNDPADAA
jgi:DNA-binding GntR family transcriptional regulator